MRKEELLKILEQFDDIKEVHKNDYKSRQLRVNYNIKKLSLKVPYELLKKESGLTRIVDNNNSCYIYGKDEDEEYTNQLKYAFWINTIIRQKNKFPSTQGLIAITNKKSNKYPDSDEIRQFEFSPKDDFTGYFIGRAINPLNSEKDENKYFHKDTIIKFRNNDKIRFKDGETIHVNNLINNTAIENYVVLSFLELCKKFNGEFEVDINTDYRIVLDVYNSSKSFSINSKDSFRNTILKNHWPISLKK